MHAHTHTHTNHNDWPTTMTTTKWYALQNSLPPLCKRASRLVAHDHHDCNGGRCCCCCWWVSTTNQQQQHYHHYTTTYFALKLVQKHTLTKWKQKELTISFPFFFLRIQSMCVWLRDGSMADSRLGHITKWFAQCKRKHSSSWSNVTKTITEWPPVLDYVKWFSMWWW